MAKREQFLVVDIGSTAVHIGEFTASGESLVLNAFDNIEYPEAITEDNRREMISGVLKRALASGKYKARQAHVCVSGQAAFMRFVKLPPVTDDEQSVRQIVAFEAKQNVPFPIDEVVWDYQLIGNEDDEDELEVMFAVIKNDIVDSVVGAVQDAHLKPKIVDFSPAALYNAARANYVGENECAMLLDIGGKCTTLLFMEGGRFFARSIPIAGASITQQISKEFNISAEEAEVLKRRYGFVALGGAYEEPESEVAATISKIVRNVMTRLHGEINRTINIYRSQQKGSKPIKLFLAGGSSTMAFTEHFFSEKLRMEVSYFNAFNIVNFAPNVDRENLSQLAHLFPGLVGCALRSVHHCPVEISLTNDEGSSLKPKMPAIIASCVTFLLALLICLGMNHIQIKRLRKTVNDESMRSDDKHRLRKAIEAANRSKNDAEEIYVRMKNTLARREQWGAFLNALQLAKPLDVWITSVEQTTASTEKAAAVTKATEEDKAIFGDFGVPTDAKKKGDNSKTEEEARYFLIKGYTVRIPEEREVDGKTVLVRRLFDDDQLVAMKNLKAKRLKGQNVTLPFIGKENRVTTSLILPEVFKESLRYSEYFSPDHAKTRLKRLGVKKEIAANLSSFEIIVELNSPIILKR